MAEKVIWAKIEEVLVHYNCWDYSFCLTSWQSNRALALLLVHRCNPKIKFCQQLLVHFDSIDGDGGVLYYWSEWHRIDTFHRFHFQNLPDTTPDINDEDDDYNDWWWLKENRNRLNVKLLENSELRFWRRLKKRRHLLSSVSICPTAIDWSSIQYTAIDRTHHYMYTATD